MSFLNTMINEFTHQGQGQGQSQQQQGYSNRPQQSGYYGGGGPSGPPPQVPAPWRSVWDAQDNRWLFINGATGQRTFDFPQGYQNTGSGYYQGERQGYNSGYGQGQQASFQQGERYEQRQDQHHGSGGHGLAYGAMGAAAGLAGGALLMHEGHEVHEDWDRDKYRVEERVDRFGDDVADAPQEVAGWTGRKVGEVEDIPQDVGYDYDRAKYGVEDRFDNALDRVEDIPQDVSYDVGQGVGDLERFDNRVDNAYDAGRDDERYDDRRDDGGW